MFRATTDLVPERFQRWLGGATQRVRDRSSVHTFYTGRPLRRDYAVTAAYFAVAASLWEERGQATAHLAPFDQGLAWCAEPARVVDLGTGTGASAAAAAGRFTEARVLGIDSSRAMLAHARRRYELPNLSFRRAYLWRLPVAAGAVDLITMLNLFPEVSELSRVIRRGGEVLVANSFGRLEDNTNRYLARWEEFGFERVRAADIGRGRCELFVNR
jgi:SAM-dependent methyltransferase